MSRTKYRRKKILVDKKFQLGISMKIIVCLACYLVLFCLMAVFSPFLVLLSGTASEEAVQAASTEVLVFVKNLLMPLALTFTCLALHCILLSHKIAGPAYRFNRTFEAMRDGDLSIDVRLRAGDYLMDVAASYNEMIEMVRADVGAMKGAAEELREGFGAGLPEDRAAAEARFGELASRAHDLAAMLERYRVSRDEEPEACEGAPAEAVEEVQEAEA